MNAVDKGTSPPPELELYWNCKRYGTLPEAGAMMDQDYRLITRMNALDAMYSAFSAYRNARGHEINRLPAWVGRNVAYIREQGVRIGLNG